MFGISKPNNGVLAEPYIKGQLGTPKNANKLFQAILALVFIAVPLTNIAIVYTSSSSGVYVPFGIIYIIVFLLSQWLESFGRPKFPLIGIDVLLFLATIVGIVGLYQNPVPQFVQISVGYTLFLLLRNFLLFTVIPRTTVLSLEEMVKYTERWAYLGAMVASVLSMIYAHSQGFGFTGARFLSDNWLHPNLVSMYCAVLVLLSVISKNVTKPFKILGLGVGIYTLLLMQSRGAILAVVAGFLAYLIFTADAKKAKALIAGIFISVGAYFAAPLVLPSLAEFSPIAGMLDRTVSADDPTAGRIQRVYFAFERAAENPIFGTGYKITFPVDSFLAYYIQEVGLVGLALYSAFLAILIWYSFRLYRHSTSETVRYIARTCIILNSFVVSRAFVESTSLMEVSDLMSNLTFLFGGLLIAGSGTLPLRKMSGETPLLTNLLKYRRTVINQSSKDAVE